MLIVQIEKTSQDLLNEVNLFGKVAPLLLSSSTEQSLLKSAINSGQEIWIDCSISETFDDLISYLDNGSSKIVVPLQGSLSAFKDAIASLPSERLIVSLPMADSETLWNQCSSLESLVSGVILPCNQSLVDTVYALNDKLHHYGFLLVNLGTAKPDLQLWGALDKKGINVILSNKSIASTQAQVTENTSSLADVYASFLTTDRPDGLFTTVVVDEQGIALGLCYSSKESISESLRTGEGVYFSRNRGLWYKGKTSGATQQLVSISADCDRDTLRFVVKQKDPGTFFSYSR